jgi:integrase
VPSIEEHHGSFRVIWRENGKKNYRTFAGRDEAEFFADSPEANPRHRRPPVSRHGKNWGYSDPGWSGAPITLHGESTPTVAAYAREIVNASDLKQNSRDMYEAAIRRVEREPLGSMEIGNVKAADVRQFFAGLTRNRDNVRSLLAKTFNAAVREDIIPKSPLVAAGVKQSKKKQKSLRVLSPDQIELLARSTTNERDGLCIRIGAYTSLRAGEVGGLRVEDVDFENCRIYVRRNAQRTSKGISADGTPKTEAGWRDFKVHCSITDDIAAYIKANPPLDDGTIFYTAQRNPVTDTVLTRATVLASERAGMKRVTFHDLRHTWASLLLRAGQRPKSVQLAGGWGSQRVMWDLYTHEYPKDDEALAETMGALRADAVLKALPAGRE